jgi:hypothetical protein
VTERDHVVAALQRGCYEAGMVKRELDLEEGEEGFLLS